MSDRSERFLRACRGESVDTTPVWLMRQAGRYMPEYRALRAQAGDFLSLCRNPELACQVTLQPVEALGVDAAILFSDILVPLPTMGIELNFGDGGPRLSAVRSAADIDRLTVGDPHDCRFVMDSIALCRAALARRGQDAVPLIGFAGAPFTLLTYAVEGGASRSFTHSKSLLFRDPAAAHRLLQKLTDTIIAYLGAQVQAGAQAVQLFDTWVGILGRQEYVQFAAPYIQQVLAALRPLGVPLIYFAQGATALLEEIGMLPADVFAIDWRLPLNIAGERLGIAESADRAIQGNLDPLRLLGPIADTRQQVADILARARLLRCGFVFNLGHGVVPETPVEHVRALVDSVHQLGRSLQTTGRLGRRELEHSTASAP